MGFLALQRHGATAWRLEQFMFQEALDAQLAAIYVGAGMATAGDYTAILT